MSTKGLIEVSEYGVTKYWLTAYSDGCANQSYKESCDLPEWVAKRASIEYFNYDINESLGPWWLKNWKQSKEKTNDWFEKIWTCDWSANAPRSNAFDIAHLIVQRHWMKWHFIKDCLDEPSTKIDCRPEDKQIYVTNCLDNRSKLIDFEKVMLDELRRQSYRLLLLKD